MPEFSIKKEEIETILQLSIQQGGSKHRQKDIYEALDRVIARGPILPEKTLVCPYCFAENIFDHNQVVATCTECKKGIFR